MFVLVDTYGAEWGVFSNEADALAQREHLGGAGIHTMVVERVAVITDADPGDENDYRGPIPCS